MAKSKDDIKYGTAQAKLSEDESLRVAYKHGTPLEAGKIADSQPLDLFTAAHNISDSDHHHASSAAAGDDQSDQMKRRHPHPATTTATATTGGG
ncbi:SEED MATURATION PROTEIN 1 [Euphorbia lathyris]|uniref:SEED MATURATION PROTEIN 1 n=1 Tax=Euphorbia lathyris TaxID=212925 RepID=UPI003313D3D1